MLIPNTDQVYLALGVLIGQVMFEINRAQYLTVIADESTDLSDQAHLVTVFRFIKLSGQVVERF